VLIKLKKLNTFILTRKEKWIILTRVAAGLGDEGSEKSSEKSSGSINKLPETHDC
jgi:hypothetical protein